MDGVPISRINHAKSFFNFLASQIEKMVGQENELLVADFASGENDEIPQYFHLNLRNEFTERGVEVNFSVYCLDLHALRIESLFDILKEYDVLDKTRIVLTRLETMTESARFPEIQSEYIKENQKYLGIDRAILHEQKIPVESFHIGILNNDVIGYLFEYYTEYTDAERSIIGIRSTMIDGGLLVVTQPGLMYRIDNIEVLEQHGFKFRSGIDFNLKSGISTRLDRCAPIGEMGLLGHYTVLVFEAV